MILRFRKRHRWMWLIIGSLLPVLYVMALMARPEGDLTTGTPMSQPLTQVLKTLASAPELDVWLTKDELGNHYLEIELKETSRHPLATFYMGQKEAGKIEAFRLLGAVGAQGRQRFPIDSLAMAQSTQYLLQYDPIRKEKVSTIQLKMQ